MTGPFARPLPASVDLIWSALAPLHDRLGAVLAALGLPPAAVAAVVDALMLAELLAVGVLVARGLAQVRARGAVTPPLAIGAALVALGLLGWTLGHLTLHAHELFMRPDHLLFAGAAGLALDAVPIAWRRVILAGLSALLLGRLYGAIALAILLGGGLLGVAAAIAIGRERRVPLIAAQAAVVAGIIGISFWFRERDLFLGIALNGLGFFLLLRHISWAVEFAGGLTPRLIDYCHYLLFYPGAAGMVGGPEVFAEFRQRNLGPRPVQLDPQLATRLLHGAACLWLSRRIPVSLEAVTGSGDFAAVWLLQSVYWIEVALFLMGVWAIVDAVALLLGVRLRQNFAHLLSCENPSDLWRAVRGTMTFWLVYHIYRPLGGNRGWQELHIAAAVGFSLVWHLVAVPFLAIPLLPLHFAPFTLWAAITTAVLIAHVYVRRREWRLLPQATPVPLRRGIHRVLTLAFASLAVTLPSFQVGASIDRFLPFVRTLLGLGG